MSERIRNAEQKIQISLIKHQGGRPPKIEVKENLKYIMRNLKYATPGMICKAYSQKTNTDIDHKTVKKYLDCLTDEKFLKKNVIFDNADNVKEGKSSIRRQLVMFKLLG